MVGRQGVVRWVFREKKKGGGGGGSLTWMVSSGGMARRMRRMVGVTWVMWEIVRVWRDWVPGVSWVFVWREISWVGEETRPTGSRGSWAVRSMWLCLLMLAGL